MSQTNQVTTLMRMSNGNYLIHHGVKGMKWGVRKKEPKSTKFSNKSNKYSAKAQKFADKRNAYEAKKGTKIKKYEANRDRLLSQAREKYGRHLANSKAEANAANARLTGLDYKLAKGKYVSESKYEKASIKSAKANAKVAKIERKISNYATKANRHTDEIEGYYRKISTYDYKETKFREKAEKYAKKSVKALNKETVKAGKQAMQALKKKKK